MVNKTPYFLILPLLLTLLAVKAMATPSILLNCIVAQVNDQIILKSTVDERMSILPESKREEVLDDLIMETLQLALADQYQIQINNDAVNQALMHITKTSPTPLKTLLTKWGITEAQYRHHIKNQLAIRQLQTQIIGPQIHLSHQDIKTQNRQRILYHVLDIHLPNQTQKTATRLVIQLRNQEAVDAPTTDLGWLTTHQLPEIFAQTITHMKPHTVSAPISAPNGIHILKLLDKKIPPVSAARKAAYEAAFIQEQHAWLQKIRHAAYIHRIHASP